LTSGPHAFSGKFGEAIKKITETGSKLPQNPPNWGDTKAVIDATKKGFDEWKQKTTDYFNETQGSVPANVQSILDQMQDISTKLAILSACVVQKIPAGGGGNSSQKLLIDALFACDLTEADIAFMKELEGKYESLKESLNKLNAIWSITNVWNLDFVLKYRNYVLNKAKDLQTSGRPFTCDDFALEIIITFCKDNNLPFHWKTGAENFTVYSKNKYPTFAEFLLAVKRKSGAPDFANDENTMLITNTPSISLQKGDVVVMTRNDGYHEIPNHVQILTETKVFGNKFSQFEAYQGNFIHSNILGRGTGSDDPESVRYLGTQIEDGIYGHNIDTWLNRTLNTTTESFLNSYYIAEFRFFNTLIWK
jgi:hypothetical protein